MISSDTEIGGPQTGVNPDGQATAGLMTLQNVIFPEIGLCTERDLYLRLFGPAGYQAEARTLLLGSGAKATFDTYFNAFSLGKWHAHCVLDGLFLALSGSGQVEIRVIQALPERSWEALFSDVVTLDPAHELLLDLSHYREQHVHGVIYFELTAVNPGQQVILHEARFMTRAPARALPELAISITTFRREAHVRHTVERLQRFLDSFEQADRIRVLVVDNGESAEIPETAKVRYLPNPNLGGAGGFARGLAEAEAAGATHCLFMDDDASFHLENIVRTYAFLALAKSPETALAGAMINNTHKWAMWENGAIFNGRCQPQFIGADLRQPNAVFRIEFETLHEHRSNFYGGWWYFAFPIAQVKYRPFPFFVRGDDVSFSLANPFKIATLNGVVSFQDDFTEKESPQTLYLDLRSHLVHHLMFDAIERGPAGTAMVAMKFILRSLVRFHYETAEVQLLALDDVMRGPQFFAENIDMAARRKTIAGMVSNESWKPFDGPQSFAPPEEKERGQISARFFAYALNGHFLPFFSRWGKRIAVPIGKRGMLHPVWGASQITYLNGTRDKAYTVKLSMARFAPLLLRSLRTAWRFTRNYKTLQQAYRNEYPQLTSQAFWDARTGASKNGR